MNQHKRITELLAVYRDLSEAEWREVEQHIRTCPECAQKLASYRAMDRKLSDLKAHDPLMQAPLQPNKRLQRAFASSSGTRNAPWWLRWMGHVPGLARQVVGVAALLLLTVGLITVFRGPASQSGSGPSVPPTATPDPLEAFATRILGPEPSPEPPEGREIQTGHVVTVTPEPIPTISPDQRRMTLCFASEPQTLLWSESALVTEAVREAIQEPLIDALNYGYSPNLVDKLPSIADGDATLQQVTIAEGDRFVDAASDRVLTLTQGMTESFRLNQLEGEPLLIEQWDGSPLTTVQQSAQWTLIEGLTWEDGTPVTAQDSLLTFNVALDPEYRGMDKQVADRTASYEALDERTLRWVGLPSYTDDTYFLNVWNPQPSHLYGTLTWAEIQRDEQANRNPLSYGPFKIDSWVPGTAITMSPNPYYVRGRTPLNSVTFRFIGDTNQMIAQLASDECDLGFQDAAFENSLPLLRGFEEQGLLGVETVAGMTFEHLDFNLQPAEGYTGAAATLRDNQGNLLFQNADFRRAIAHCLDRQTLIDQALNGGGFLQHTYVPSDHPLYPGDEAITTYSGTQLERGQALLASLGWTDTDGDGILNDDAGTRLTFNLVTRQNLLRDAITQIVQAQLLQNCGIAVSIEMMGSEFFAEGPEGPIFGRAYDVAEFAWLTAAEPPCNLYVSSQVPGEINGWGASNNTGFANADFDAACAAALNALDPEEKAAHHAEAMAIWTDQLPSIPLFARSKLTVVRPEVEGVILDPTNPTELWNIENFDVRR
jgi:peptide/nickel transport system substrate-binding protein